MITDYASLQAAVASGLHRSTDTDILAELPRFVQMAEQEIFRELPLRILETSVTGTTTGPTIAIPAGTASIDKLALSVNTNSSITLDYTPASAREWTAVGQPKRYALENGVIRLLPPPDSPYAYTLYIVPDLTPLSTGNPTNWLLLNAPDVYLLGTTIQAVNWTKDGEEAARCIPMFERAIDSIRRKDARKRFPTTGGLQIKPRGVR